MELHTLQPKEPINSDKEFSSNANEMKTIASIIEEDLSSEISKISLAGTQVGVVLKKKLIVLDINGVLVDIVSPTPKDCKADKIIARQAIFKRPFCREFLEFCFEKFEVGIWSTRMKKNVIPIVDFLMGDMKNKLLFFWDVSHCTQTSFGTLENKYKKVVFKDLRKLWTKRDPNLPWEKGYYNESNTLLLDDTIYKGLLNPPHTSVFPHAFSYQNKSDNSLAEGGDIRKYLNGLANAENVQKYVEEHPFGQERMNETSESWKFYVKVLESLNKVSRRPVRRVQWQFPPEGVIAINVDGGYNPVSGSGGIGGILRDSSGNWKGGFYGYVQAKDNIYPELLAIYKGLTVAKDLCFQRVLCFSDCRQVVNMIKNGASDFHEYASVVADIRSLLHHQWEVSIEHVLRGGNACADFLAKCGAYQTQPFTLLEDVPPGLKPLFFRDLSSASHLRL